MSDSVVEEIEKEKLIVIVRGAREEQLIPLCEALYDGGVRLVELTYSANGSVSDTQTAENIEKLVSHFGERITFGSGTVLTPVQVELTKNAGGKFIISPDTSRAVIERTKELGLVSIPGALTSTEAVTAHKYGADFVKLFPVTSLGAGYVKAIRAPLSHIKFLAVGGIDENNMSEYLAAGALGFGIGGNIVSAKMLSGENYGGITALAKKYTEEIAKWQDI